MIIEQLTKITMLLWLAGVLITLSFFEWASPRQTKKKKLEVYGVCSRLSSWLSGAMLSLVDHKLCRPA